MFIHMNLPDVPIAVWFQLLARTASGRRKK
jgi:hypothetical protein